MPDRSESALIVVDIQPDFLPGGRLAVAEGDRVIPGIDQLLRSNRFGVRVATQDWHPPEHISFASEHPGRKPFDRIELYGREQVLWPDHCIQGTDGAALHPSLPWDEINVLIRKATDPRVDSYSAFRNNWGPGGDRPPTGLAGLLRERGVKTVHLCGLARDYCVRWSAEDGVDAGFEVVVHWELTRSVDPSGDTALRAALESLGVRVLDGSGTEL